MREEQNKIRGQTPCVAEFVQASHERVRPLLADLCDFVNTTGLPPLVQAAVAQA